jgi:hypothetical protein
MNKSFYFGLALLFLSYFQFLVPQASINLLVLITAWSLFMLGIVFISEGITLKFKNYSLLKTLFKSKRNLISYLALSTLGGILLEIYAQWLGKLWIYPYLNTHLYFLVFTLGFAMYWLMIVESYLAAKAILDKLRKGKKLVTKYYKREGYIYNYFGLFGPLLLAGATLGLYIDYSTVGTYYFSVNEILNYKVNFIFVLLAFIGLVFIFEFVEYRKRKTSFLKDLLHEYPVPLFSILFAFLVTALIMETVNTPNNFWVYLNWPYEHITFAGLPVSMLLAWPLHYLGFLSMFRAFSDENSVEIWRGDLIK